jgi:signal transduction histidine kinase/CheY-like chemotaxis protein
MRRLSRPKYRDAMLLAGITIAVLALGWIVGRDLRQFPDAATSLYTRLARGLDLIDELEFTTQEARRILLYALHTTDANLQLEYAEQSRTAALRVQQLLATHAAIIPIRPGTRGDVETVAHRWREYVIVRDEVIGLILEGSLREGVALDQDQGTARFNGVRAAIATLKARFESDAAVQVSEARIHAERAMRRLLFLVVSALLAAAVGIFLVNRRAALEAVEIELRRARDAAQAAAEAKSDFLATMSHELRTPLNGVIGIADLLQAEELSPRQRELARMLRSSATALHGLVSDILDYSRVEAGLMELSPTSWDVAACIEDAFDSVTEIAGRKGLDVGYVIDPEVPPAVIADRDRVSQVLLNLISNGLKFTEAGEVSVHVTAAPIDAERLQIRFRVRDTGIGIPQHLHGYLFKRFSQLDAGTARRHGGTGLGLAISERLSRLLGGSLGVESDSGCGATFTFAFAASRAPSDRPAEPAAPFDGVRVLARLAPGVVGDQLRSTLCRWGARVSGVPEPGITPDVVVSDADAEQDIGTHPTSTPLIAVTRRPAVARTALGSAVYVIGKPVRARALEEALRHALGLHAPSSYAGAGLAAASFGHRALAILLVEDNAANRRVVQMMLEELGVEGVDEAVSGAEAVKRAGERDYDVILMDLQMPGLDGLEATRRIRAAAGRQRPVIIALTANAMQGEESRCREAGMDAYLAKPLRLERLAAALTGAVA